MRCAGMAWNRATSTGETGETGDRDEDGSGKVGRWRLMEGDGSRLESL